MVLICEKCKIEIGNKKESLTCFFCKHCYHVTCTAISQKLFGLLEPVRKAAWRCKNCPRNIRSPQVLSTSFKSTKPHSNITLRCKKVPTNKKVSETKSPLNANIASCSSTPKIQENVQINIPIHNSFESLSSSDDEVEADDDLYTTIHNNRSLPDLSTNFHVNDELEKTKASLLQLQEQLKVAENEIANQLTENYALKSQLSKCEQKINTLTRLCTSQPISRSPSCIQPRILELSTNDEAGHLNAQVFENDLIKANEKIHKLECELKKTQNNMESLKNEIDTWRKVCKSVNMNDEILDATDVGLLECCSDASIDLQQEDVCSKQNVKKNIYILGDEQLRGFSAALKSSRYGKWNDNYNPFAFIMTGATSTELLAHCDSIACKLSSSDIVILGISSNDCDIQKLHANLCILINKFSKATVFVAPVNRNHYLNEQTLNKAVKLWTKHFDNCNVIDMDCCCLDDVDYLNNICAKLNLSIDYTEYETQFLTFSNIRAKLRKSTSLKKNIDENHSNTKLSAKKGTIPYYFRARQPITTTHTRPENVPENTSEKTNEMNAAQSERLEFFRVCK